MVRYRAVQGDGLHLLVSVSFLKFDEVTHGPLRYCGSRTIVVTTNHSAPSGSLNESKNSFTVASALYGIPFFRR